MWEKFCGRHPVIDIGCGWHPIFGFEYIKFDKASRVLGMPTCVNHYGDFHDMSDFADNTFAFVNATNVIEHAQFLEKALNEWIRILRVGGILHLTWPSLDVLECRKLEELQKAVNENDLDKYRALGGNLAHVSIDKDGKMFLDAHWNFITLNGLKKLAGDRLEVIVESGCSLIAKKVY